MLERKIPRLLSVVLFAVCSVVPLTAQITASAGGTDPGFGGQNTINGMILGPSGERLQRRITIRLQTQTKGDRVLMSDDYGNFSFRGLPSGEYTIVIDKEKEFEPYRQSVSVTQFRGFPPQTYMLSIRLQFKVEAKAKPGVVDANLVNVPRPALVHYNNAADLSRKNDHTGAIAELKLAIKEYPTFMLAFNELGVQYLKLNQLENADEAFQGALKIDPEAFPALVNRGIANFMMKRYGEAVPILHKALKKNDESAVAHYFLGQSLANLGLFVDAEKELLLSVKLGNEDMKEAHRLLAIIYSSRGDKKQAAAELEAYLQLAPDAPDAQKLKEKIRELKEPNE
ncbi:MAG TPA: tetratricopeptide repeat protein [Pyrinomonadaceae bacterium]